MLTTTKTQYWFCLLSEPQVTGGIALQRDRNVGTFFITTSSWDLTLCRSPKSCLSRMPSLEVLAYKWRSLSYRILIGHEITAFAKHVHSKRMHGLLYPDLSIVYWYICTIVHFIPYGAFPSLLKKQTVPWHFNPFRRFNDTDDARVWTLYAMILWTLFIISKESLLLIT